MLAWHELLAQVVEDVARRLAEWRTAQEQDMTARDEALEQLEEAVRATCGVLRRAMSVCLPVCLSVSVCL